jgi:APA family basic amino acid/polyamine antiporter
MLSRSITPLHATALVVGIIIGASIFVQPSVITGAIPTVGGVYAVWIVSGILTLFGALIAAELASAYPRAGGVYVFLREAFSPAVAFLWGWAMFWTMHTGIIAVIAMVFARYVSFFVPVGDVGLRVLATAAVIALTAVNYVGVRQGSLVQTTLTILKVGAVVAIIVVAFVLGPRNGLGYPGTIGFSLERASNYPFTFSQFPLAVVAGLFAFGGWHMVTYAAEETREPERTIPRALVSGVLIVTACYIALNAAYFHVLLPAQIAMSTRVAADAADAVLGTGGAAFMSAVVAISTFGALNGVILSGPRAYLAMARDGLLVAWAAAISYATPRDPTPRCLGRHPRVDGNLPRALYARRLHRMDFLRAHGVGPDPSSWANRLRSRVSCVGISHCPGGVHRLLGLHRNQSDHRRCSERRDWFGIRCRWTADLPLVAAQALSSNRPTC